MNHMSPQKIQKAFTQILRQSQKTVPFSKMRKQHKYRNELLLFKRFYTLMSSLRLKGMRKGLDVGCSHGSCAVLGKLMGIEVIGIEKSPSKYEFTSHAYLKTLGLNFFYLDDSYPWQFEANEFGFIIALFSLNKEWKYIDCDQHIKELSRITRPRGMWVIEPKRMRKYTQTSGPVLEKNIQVIGDGKACRVKL